jgi:hypothetical protein
VAVDALHSRLLVPALLRPFGEHLIDMVQPLPDDVCVDVSGPGGVMPALLAHRARTCITVNGDEAAALSLRDGSAQVVTALFAPLSNAVLRELLRILDPHRGRLACALSVELPGDVRIGTPAAPALDIRPTLRITHVRDVARFDGTRHFNAATGAAATDAQLQPYVAPDGTLRIPVDAVVVRAEPH